MAKITIKQRRFVEEYLIDLNATKAAIRAGYSARTAAVQGVRLLRNVNVRVRIDEVIAELSRRTGINQERVIRELARIAFVNAADVIDFETATIRADPERDDTAAIASMKVRTFPTAQGVGIERETRLVDKLKALELLGKHLGMFTYNVNITGSMGVQIIDDI